MARRKSNDPVATCVKERIGADDEGENLLTPDKIERCVDFAGAAGRQRAKLQASARILAYSQRPAPPRARRAGIWHNALLREVAGMIPARVKRHEPSAGSPRLMTGTSMGSVP